MLKSITVTLTGADAGTAITLTELPALVADRYARTALAAIGEDDAASVSGVVALALQQLEAVRQLGARGLKLLQPFLGDAQDTELKDWRSVRILQNAALLLHVGFLTTRQPLEVPIRVQAAMIEKGVSDIRASFCSAQIAAVLLSGKATYRELETVLSTEDVYNIVELLNVEALRHLLATEKPPKP